MGILDRDYANRAMADTAAASFSQKVYGWMTLGLLVTGLVSLYVVKTGLFVALLPYTFLLGLGTLGLAFGINAALTRASFNTMALLFLSYSALQGLFFGAVLPVYAAAIGGQLIWTAFVTAGVIFGGAVLYGLFTKTDLSQFAKIFQIALFGLIGITVVYAIASMFTHIPGLVLLISYLGLVLFVGMTAFDAQQIRRVGAQVGGDSVMARKLSLMMALKMYLNVIMIFWYLLQILSFNRRS